MLKTYKKRPAYLKKIKPYINKELIKVLIGQRRVGKSYLLLQIIDEIKSTKVSENRILYINKELYEFDSLKNYKDLTDYVSKYFKDVKSKKYLFVDEIQEIEGFHKAVRSFNASGEFDIYITGSNADLLSKDIANLLGGRYISFEILGLSYSEFLDFYNLQGSKSSLEKYLRFGTMPYLIHLDEEEEVFDNYLRNIFNTIFLKDIVKQYEIRNVDFLERLIYFLADNIGNSFSARSISEFLKSQRTSLSIPVILNYLKYINSSFFIHQVPRFDIQGKKVFQTNEKYYFNDLGIRNALVGYKTKDITKVLENIVYLHLRSLGHKVRVAAIGSNKEVDFITEQGSEIAYFQVTYRINNDKTYDREFKNLVSIDDNYPKYIITMEEIHKSSIKGVKHLYLEDFLLNFPADL
jgi:uncharacterized protein